MKTIANILVYIMVLALIACSCSEGNGSGKGDGEVERTGASDGGGAVGSGNGPPNVNSTPVAITKENGHKIALAVLSGIVTIGDREETLGLITGGDVTRTANERVGAVVAEVGNGNSRSAEDFTLECGSGSINYAANDANTNGQLDAGDTVSIKFNSCVETDEEDGTVYTSNGAVALKINSISADGESVNAAASYTNLVLREGDFARSINGNMTLVVQTDGDMTVSTVSGEKIEFTNDDTKGILSHFSLRDSFNEQTRAWTEFTEATMASTEIGGQVIIKTITELQGVGDDYAATGELKIEGTKGSLISLNAKTDNVDTMLITVTDGGATATEEFNWDDL